MIASHLLRPSDRRRKRSWRGVALISFFLFWAYTAPAQQRAYIGGPPEAWDLDAVQDVLADLSPDLIPDIDGFIDVLYDYAQEGYVPRNLDGMSFKRVPMINEIVMSNSVTRLPGNGPSDDDYLVLRVHIAVETWYPFPQPPEMPDFTVHMDMPPYLSVLPPAYSGLQDMDLIEIIADPAGPHIAYDFRVTRFTFEAAMQVPMWPTSLAYDAQPDDMEVRLPGGAVVDRVLGQWPEAAFRFFLTLSPAPAYGEPWAVGPARSYSAYDPRLNADPSDAPNGPWRAWPRTLGTINEDPGGSPMANTMYCAQRAFQSVAEITNLLYRVDRPRQTVRLIGSDPDQTSRIIERLTVNKDGYGTPYSWLIEHGYTNDIDAAELEIGPNNFALWQSYIAGLIPGNASSRFKIQSVIPGGGVAFQTVTGRLYSVFHDSTLLAPTWQNALTNDLPGTGGPVFITDDSHDQGRFYQIRVRLP